jgi:hypothetical protein
MSELPERPIVRPVGQTEVIRGSTIRSEKTGLGMLVSMTLLVVLDSPTRIQVINYVSILLIPLISAFKIPSVNRQIEICPIATASLVCGNGCRAHLLYRGATGKTSIVLLCLCAGTNERCGTLREHDFMRIRVRIA